MRTHTVKCHPHYFKSLLSGAKNNEFRLNDRDYKAGDDLIINCGNDSLLYKITHVLTHDDFSPVPIGYAVLSLRPSLFSATIDKRVKDLELAVLAMVTVYGKVENIEKIRRALNDVEGVE